MPCFDPGDRYSGTKTSHGMTFDHFEAALCGVLSAIERVDYDKIDETRVRALFDQVDWQVAGIKRRTVEIWWHKHKEEDAERRAREAAEKQRETLRHAALSKLTLEERAALGIK
jgi:hypothetical protein